MKIDERNAVNTQKPQSGKIYETKADVTSRGAKTTSPALQDGVALEGQDQLRARAMAPTAEETSHVARLTQLVQSGQYQVDPVALSGAMVEAMLKGY